MRLPLFCAITLVTLCVGCQPIVTSNGFRVTPLAGVKLDTASVLTDSSPMILDAGKGSVITVRQNASNVLNVVRYDQAMKAIWQKHIALAGSDRLESTGVHISDSKLYCTIISKHADDVQEYRALVFDAATGDSLPEATLMRLNTHDIGDYPDAFTHQNKIDGAHAITSNWSPDSSKILLFKKYGAGEGRISIELMLYRAGFSLITKTNVDFRLDTSTQQVIGILPDNDGVAYIFLRNLADSSIDVGRYEMVGSRKLRSLKYADIDPNAEGTIRVAPRGHAFIVRAQAGSAKLIDLDYFANRSHATELGSLGSASELQQVPQLFVLPDQDRLIVTRKLSSDEKETKGNIWIDALDLDLASVWHGIEWQPPTVAGYRRMAGGIGYGYFDADTLMIAQTNTRDGMVQKRPVAIVTGESRAWLSAMVMYDKRVYFDIGKLYRLIMP